MYPRYDHNASILEKFGCRPGLRKYQQQTDRNLVCVTGVLLVGCGWHHVDAAHELSQTATSYQATSSQLMPASEIILIWQSQLFQASTPLRPAALHMQHRGEPPVALLLIAAVMLRKLVAASG